MLLPYAASVSTSDIITGIRGHCGH